MNRLRRFLSTVFSTAPTVVFRVPTDHGAVLGVEQDIIIGPANLDDLRRELDIKLPPLKRLTSRARGPEEHYIDLRTASSICKVSSKRLAELLRQGKLTGIRTGSKQNSPWLVSTESLRARYGRPTDA